MNELIKADTGYMMNTVNPDLLARFIAFLDTSPKTIATYSRALKQFFKYLADNGITAPARADILTYREQLKASGHRPATVQSYIIAVRQFFKWAASEGICPDVAQNIKGAPVDREHKKDYLTSRQIKTVFAGIDGGTLTGARDYAILAVMTTGGLRTIEVIRADIDDLRALGDDTVLYVQGKGHAEKGAYIMIAPPTEKAIREYLKLRGRASGSDPLFASVSNNSAGGRMTTRSISRIVKDRLITAGLDSTRLTAHSLRHTCAIINMANGGTQEETQQLLRHTNPATTQIYTRIMDRARNKSEARVAKAIFG